MDKREALQALQGVLEDAKSAGAKPGDHLWQPKIDRAWRRALDAGVRCHIHVAGPGERWILTTDMSNSPKLGLE